MTIGNVLLLLVLVALNGFFVSVEFSAVASRRARLDLIAGTDSPSARLVRSWLEQPAARDRLIAATQLGITLVSLALGAAGENTFAALLEPYFRSIVLPDQYDFLRTVIAALPLVISLTVVTSLHVVLGEQVPKVAVLHAPERFALSAAPIMRVFSAVFKWFIDLLDWATRLVLSIAGLPATTGHTSMYTIEEIKQMVTGPEVEGVIDPPEQEMLSAVINFGELVVRQVTTPRTEIIAADADQTASEVLNMALEHAITKIPVYQNSLDEIIGIVHLRDLVKVLQSPNGQDKRARDLAREALFVPETISVNDLLLQLRARRTHIAIVLDEYGGTYGLVTLEDLLEQIVGDVQDPFETTPPSIQSLPDGSALVDGMAQIDEINDHFGLKLSDPDYDTIAGYILGKLGRIAQTGDQVEDEANRICLIVEKMDRLRIAQVHLSRLP
jgi:CBS domain containing-hemolysin-like protein